MRKDCPKNACATRAYTVQVLQAQADEDLGDHSEMILDSGASETIIKDRAFFKELETANVMVRFGGGELVAVTSIQLVLDTLVEDEYRNGMTLSFATKINWFASNHHTGTPKL
jgi:hypothetical protein